MQRTCVTAVVVALASAVALTGALASSGASAPARASGAFAWLHPASPPAGWILARTPGGATLAVASSGPASNSSTPHWPL